MRTIGPASIACGLWAALLAAAVAVAPQPEVGTETNSNTGRCDRVHHGSPAKPAHLRRVTCFAPNTPPEVLQYYDHAAAYSAVFRWSVTANGGTGSSGYPITLTYSFVPDGVQIPNGGVGGPAQSPNILKATLDAAFGSTEAWKNQFRAAFARWSELCGVNYVEETNDDGADFPNSQGQLGVRGDVRLAMRSLDGTNNVLAFNYYPNLGDMVLDSAENWSLASDSYRFLRNTLMHEAGHGLGLGHVWPLDQSKLMEPILITSFDGPQDDDIRGGHYYYGDLYEVNSSAASATNLGTVSGTVTASNASARSTSDADWYKFYVDAPKDVTITVTPQGSTYQVGSSSGSTPSVNTKAVGNLAFVLRNTDGSSILAEVDGTVAGQAEYFTASLVNAGTYYAQVYASSSSGPQRYEISVVNGALSDPCGVDTDGNGVGDHCDSQLALVGCPEDLSVSANGAEGANVFWDPPQVTGAYGSWTLAGTREPGDFFDVGETEVTYTAGDSSGKTAQCSFRVTVSATLVAGETAAGPCGLLSITGYALMLIPYALVLVARRR